jgi:23S rRNA pseudouridine2605 synthase
MERIQKILAEAGVCSRRAAEKLIRQGRVSVGGETASLGHKGVITTLNDPQGRPCLADYLRRHPTRLYPVGRLDNDASGLLVLTNDGQLAQRLMHPSYGVKKTYLVAVRGRADQTALTRLKEGVMVGDRPTAPATVKLLESRGKNALLSLTIHEGRHHQVKRMCSQVGLVVEELKRIKVGPLSLKDLEPGKMRPLKKEELARLKKAVGLIPSGRRR